ncbi:mitochondrial ATP synthase g subunit-domain-containing protein [Kockiozyma suomiensis]|uniref:mitochondrial ATP synthase g subunit-domain-containing protein n=1 Tax=Kockiozyma suomiensis TaxID=1337062 RepID=UPI0033434340
MQRQSFSSPLRTLYGGAASRALLRQQVRQNSTLSTIVARANGAVTLAKTTFDNTLYWSKVVAEVAKQAYLKEAMSPPSIETFKSTYISLYQSLLLKAKAPEELIAFVKSLNGKSILAYSAYGIQILGFFSLGEIVGRRKLVGY